MYLLVITEGEEELRLMGAAVVVSKEGEFLMVETMISNRSRVVRSVLVVVSFTSGVDVMALAVVAVVVAVVVISV